MPSVAKERSKPKKEEKKPKKGAPKKAAPAPKKDEVPKKTQAQKLAGFRRAAVLLKHISDPTRVQVLMMLHDGAKHVGAICEWVQQSQPATSHHLALLRHGGVVVATRNGKQMYYDLTDIGHNLTNAVLGMVK